jgi:3-dehydroquinate synthetase
MKTIIADIGGARCRVNIGADIGRALRRALGEAGGRVFVVCDAQVYALHGKYLSDAGLIGKPVPRPFVLPCGEKYKNDRTLSALHDHFLDQRITRDDLIVAVGGGVTTDLAGFAAATVLRGVPWGAVPTTLLGMVDAGLGGKTGLNHARGKNLIGAFWQPILVHIDLQFLSTLPRREMVAGLGEVLKYGGLMGNRPTGGRMLDMCSRLLLGIDEAHPGDFLPVVAASAAHKLAVVSRDERDVARRLTLNFGHTVGHAVEKAAGYGRLRHGEAVILGMLAALELGKRLGFQSQAVGRYQAMVETAVGLAPRLALEVADIMAHLNLDKKRTSEGLRFVLIERPGRPIIQNKVDRRTVRAAVTAMVEFYRTHGGACAKSTSR